MPDAGLAAAELTPEYLARLEGSDPRKLAFAWKLCHETITFQPWTTKRLHMRSAANVSRRLRQLDLSRFQAAPLPNFHRCLESTPPGIR